MPSLERLVLAHRCLVPAEVSAAAEAVWAAALRVQPLLKALIGDAGRERRQEAYQRFREAYEAFIDAARRALEVR